MARLGLGLVGLLLVGACALAGEAPDLQKQLDELKAKVNALEKKQAEAPAPAAGESKGGFWTENVKFFGDLRLRGDYMDQPDRETPVADRERLRFRARLGLEAKVNEEVDLRFRIATAESKKSDSGGDPTSNNQTVTNDFSKKALWWDLAMFDYHPAAVPGLHLQGGKIEQPFVAVGRNDMIWNTSLTPEGGAVKYQPKFGDFEPIAVAGAFWIQERYTLGTDTADSGLFGGQLGLKYNLSKEAYVLGGGGYFDYVHAKNFPVFDYSASATPSAKGNTLSPDYEYRYDYNEAEAFLEIGFACPLTGLPVALFGDWVKNTAAGDNAQGFLAGARLGKLEKPWDWSLYYDYRRLEKDCVVGAFNGTDAFDGGTDGKGHKFGAELQLMKNLWVGAYYYLDKVNISPDDATDEKADFRRAQLDINFKF
jgi:hypothetical protein